MYGMELTEALAALEGGEFVVVYEAYGRGWEALPVTRLTPGRIWVGSAEYDRKTGRRRGYGGAVGPLTAARIEEARLDALQRRYQAAIQARSNKLRIVDWDGFTPEALDQVLALVASLRAAETKP